MSGYPIHGSNESRLRDFFERNPDEELSADDISVKFRISKNAAWKTAHRLRCRGFLVSHGAAPVVYRRSA